MPVTKGETGTLGQQLAKAGKNKVFVAMPGFTADCLETLDEINMEAREAFLHAGGEKFSYIHCLNDSPDWITALAGITTQHLAGWPTQDAPNTDALNASRQAAIALGAKQ